MTTQIHRTDTGLLSQIRTTLIQLRASMLEFETDHAGLLDNLAEGYRDSGRNLLHYIALRRQDLRALQSQLASAGLSSIGRLESHALSSIDTVLGILDLALPGESATLREATAVPCDLVSGHSKLNRHSDVLLGPALSDRTVRMMVTVPSEAACDYTVVHELLENGMSCMRINCAHDDADAWRRMIEHLRQARATLNRQCSVLMDLGGPKLRTGAVEPGPATVKIRPRRDAYGRVSAPARVWFTDQPGRKAPSEADAELIVASEWISAMEPDDKLLLRDTRGRRRMLRIVDIDRGGLWAELNRTAYVTNGTKVRRERNNNAIAPMVSEISGIPASDGRIMLQPRDILLLTRDQHPGRGASHDSAGNILSPAHIPCTLPEVFADVRSGEKVYLDDGQVAAVVETVSADEVRVRIEHTPPRGARLGADKGINLPESKLRLPALTPQDIEDLQFAAVNADMIGLSFANHESDVQALIGELRTFDAPLPGIVLKIETRRGFARLPAMLLTAMQHTRVGVMIARGDLAVECGYERLAEAQEEILWICEAAHCPAIWATQVLESLAKNGTPSRAEITDAAMGHRAECVMLNKGPYIGEALRVLDDILKRMDSHQSKKRSMLRALSVATGFDGVASANDHAVVHSHQRDGVLKVAVAQ